MNFCRIVSTVQYILRRDSLCLQGRLNKVFYISIYIFSTIQNFKVYFYPRRFVSDLSDSIVTSLMTPRLSGHFPIFGLVFLLNSLLEIARQRSRQKIAILTPKRRSLVGILIHRTWSFVYLIYGEWILADSSHHPDSKLVLCHQHGLVPHLSTSVPLTAKIIKTYVRH